MAASFPFETVIISFPDQAAADSAGASLQELQGVYKVSISATCDPFSTRVGSGGGTLAALSLCSFDASVLILHAGGASSRCPTQMVLGKAMASLCTKSAVTSPLRTILHKCQELFGTGVEKGSVVVVAADALWLLNDPPVIDWRQYSVVGVTVPAPLETAQRHGVYAVADAPGSLIRPCTRVLQKASLDMLREVAFLQDGSWMAWIDSGIVVFGPRAAQALRMLATGPLDMCTKEGLLIRYEQDHGSGESLQSFAARTAISVDLYTHVLQALRTSESPATLEHYLQENASSLPPAVAKALFDSLSLFDLHVYCANGQFLHLGTTREWLDFSVWGSASVKQGSVRDPRQALCERFGASLQLSSRKDTFFTKLDTTTTSVLYQSILNCHERSKVGAHTVVEHCDIQARRLDIGSQCVISGLRGAVTESVRIPDNMIVQQIRVAKSETCVHMVLGVDDVIKASEKVYGRPIGTFLNWSDLSEDELWSSNDRTLWTAKLHPVIPSDLTYPQVFGWLNAFTSESNADLKDPSWQLWKASRRLSLSEIRDLCDATVEFEYRRDLANRIETLVDKHLSNIRDILMERRRECIDLQFIVDEYAVTKTKNVLRCTLRILDGVFREALKLDMYDVCGRACMVVSALLEELARVPPMKNEVTVDVADVLESFRLSHGAAAGDLVKAYDRLVAVRNESLSTGLGCNLFEISASLEAASHSMTQRCVCGSNRVQLSKQRDVDPIYGRWVVSSAPARIDLAGGWTDTPPVCYEYGSAVTGIAILVDGRKPLSCACRILKGDWGVVLRSESRDSFSGELLSAMETKLLSLDDLRDFRNPQADCALHKCALVFLGLVNMEQLETNGVDFRRQVNEFCGQPGEMESVQLEIITTSFLPHGSGLGSSSILGGCVISSVGRCIGLDFDVHELVDAVLKLEQLMTTGGGFQDQVNGLFGGCKLVVCKSLQFPLYLDIQQLSLSSDFKAAFNQALILVFTGKTRLAKNILQSVLRRWAVHADDIDQTVGDLVQGAQEAQGAIRACNLDKIGEVLSAYWSQKKIMAGLDSHVEPLAVSEALKVLKERKAIRGGSMCGAGGGGFIALLASDTFDARSIRALLDEMQNDEVKAFEFHTGTICDEGITTIVQHAIDHNDATVSKAEQSSRR